MSEAVMIFKLINFINHMVIIRCGFFVAMHQKTLDIG